jgi:hypothetical protein
LSAGAGGHCACESSSFFYITIKKGTPAQVTELFQGLERDINGLLNNCIELSYFMRGAISYEEMMLRTPGERQRIGDFISNRLKVEVKKPYPVY